MGTYAYSNHTKALSLVSIAPAYRSQELPKSWDPTEAAGVSNAMQMLMLGCRTLARMPTTNISNCIQVTTAQSKQGLLPGTNFTRTDPAEVRPPLFGKWVSQPIKGSMTLLGLVVSPQCLLISDMLLFRITPEHLLGATHQ